MNNPSIELQETAQQFILEGYEAGDLSMTDLVEDLILNGWDYDCDSEEKYHLLILGGERDSNGFVQGSTEETEIYTFVGTAKEVLEGRPFVWERVDSIPEIFLDIREAIVEARHELDNYVSKAPKTDYSLLDKSLGTLMSEMATNVTGVEPEIIEYGGVEMEDHGWGWCLT